MLILPNQTFLTFNELGQRWGCEDTYIKYLVEMEQLPVGDKFAAIRGKRNTLFISVDPQNPDVASDIEKNEDNEIVLVTITDYQVPFWNEVMQTAKDRLPETSIPVIFMTDILAFELQHHGLNSLADDVVVGKRQQQIAKIKDVIKIFGFDCMAIPDGGRSEMKKYCLSNHPRLFTSNSFDGAWKDGRKEELFKMASHFKYTK